MHMKNEESSTLLKFTKKLQSQGRYSFSKKETIASLKISSDAFKIAAWRLIKKKHLIRPKHNFYVIVPLEYLSSGSPPVSWFIDDLMQYLKIPYYVGLLTAAAIYGAGHQQPNVFQIITTKTIRPININSITIDFICSNLLKKSPIKKIQTPTGYMNVSTPETTAYDLVKYLPLVGHINNVATILIELTEKIQEDKLVKIAQKVAPVRSTQRLGYILDYINSRINTDRLAQVIQKKKAQYIPLVYGKKIVKTDFTKKNSSKNKDGNRSERWKILINETIEPDLDYDT